MQFFFKLFWITLAYR